MRLILGSGIGRSEKTDEFWIRASWARDRSEMNTIRRKMIWRLMIGPCFACKVRRKGTSWVCVNDFLSHKRVVMIGTCGGPGGRLTLFVFFVVMERVDLINQHTHRETKTMNHVSILVSGICWKVLVILKQKG